MMVTAEDFANDLTVTPNGRRECHWVSAAPSTAQVNGSMALTFQRLPLLQRMIGGLEGDDAQPGA